MGFLRIRKVRSNDANGCAVEKPFLQILCFDCGMSTRMDTGTLCAQQTNQAYVWPIYCGCWWACLRWACLIQLRLAAMPGFYVSLYYRFYEVYSSSVTITPGALSTHLYEALRTDWNPVFLKDFWFSPPPRHTQNTKSTRNHPSGPPLQ